MWNRRRNQALDGLEDEIRDHVERETEINIARGMSPDEARRQALIAFGNVALVREDAQSAWTWTWLEQARQDVRFGARILKNSPGLSVTAVVLIALVVGINTTIFSMINGLVTQPAPGVNPEGLVRIAIPERPGAPLVSYPDYVDYRAQTTALQSLTAFTNGRVAVTSDSGSHATWAAAVDANFFDTIGVRLLRGRAFTADEGRSTDTAGLVAIVSYRAWQDVFGGAEDIVGRAIAINNHPATVIGVAPPNFRGTMLNERADVWLPLLMYWSTLSPETRQRAMTERGATPVDMIGRLTPGKSIAAAQTDFATMQARLNRSYPTADRPRVAVVQYAATAGGVIPSGAPMLLAIFSVITLMTVLIVSANVANLMLSRAVARQRETAVRQSLGASRTRIVRLLLAEGLSISVVAWSAACLMTIWAARAIPRLLPDSPFGQAGIDFGPNWRVVAYAMVLAAIGTIAFSLAPALRVWRQDALPWLKAGEHNVAPGRSRLSNGLVVLQLAFSVVLLTLAGLATRSASLMTVDLGFDSQDLLLLTTRTTGSVTTREGSLALIDRIRERLQVIPGVQRVSYVRPFFPATQMVRTPGAAGAVRATMHVVGPEYFPTMGLAPTVGRTLTIADRERAGAVAMINQNLADSLWPGQNPLGKTMTLRALTFQGVSDEQIEQVEVVGMTPNAFVGGFNPERPDPRPNLLFVAEQKAFGGAGRDPAVSGEITFYLRHGRSDLESVAAALGPVLREVEPRAAIVSTLTMDARLDNVTFTARMIARLLLIFSLISLLIAAIGQYAVIAFNMRRRIREFGVRIALGASARQVLSNVLGEGFALTAIGLLVGLLLSLGVAFAVRGALFGVTPTDGPTYAGVFLVLACVALVACCVPALAATRVDPVQALRQESSDRRMEVRVYSNTRRPGVGMPPKREGSRPLLPQHARHCPVLEAGSALGFMVYASLEPKESVYVEFEGDGRYKFVYYLQMQSGKRSPIFQVTMSMSVGGVGMMKEEVTFVGAPMLSREAALAVMRAFLVPEDMGTPSGAIALRGATNFQTPTGWDTVYTPILNMIERPMAPMLSVRVETDWYSHETEFRYVLQPGEGITLEHSIPIGQIFFVPREEITMRQCTAEELKSIEAARDEFHHHKTAATQQTSYGLSYSPHYLRQSRAQKE